MRKRDNDNHELPELSVPTAIATLVAYFTGEGCLGCAHAAVEFLTYIVERDAEGVERAQAQRPRYLN